MPGDLITFFDNKVKEYNQPSFIKDDPISIPHQFNRKQDIEIAGLFAAIFAWGNRTIIINKTKDLLQRMDNAPYDFVKDHKQTDLKNLLGFKHRTFNDTDLLYFVHFLNHHYRQHKSLEDAFAQHMTKEDRTVEKGMNGFFNYFFSLEDAPARTQKHIASPEKNSTCKRLSMYLRWMVRSDNHGVDFGIWKKIKPSQLICPIDVHVARVAYRFNLLNRRQLDWQAALELTNYLKKLDKNDPVKYDFALFGLGVVEKF
ncbi:TIGR02757 family protein [Aridibaculum aurantiacum]|uniref:TIGR02757 family protein n=1 Tax=Aridibaculum aurantiacum TaxID=2810307 RepID=UPI0031592E37